MYQDWMEDVPIIEAMKVPTVQSREMTADELFEELDYWKFKDDNKHIIYRKIDLEIVFWKEDNIFLKTDCGEMSHFTMQELKAINKKCKELGWIREI
jgi:hypothetical protein